MAIVTKNTLSFGLILLGILSFLASRFSWITVQGDSMYPTIFGDEKVLMLKTPRCNRGDIILFKSDSGHNASKVFYIKRLIGLPGDCISAENGHWINHSTNKEYQPEFMADIISTESDSSLTTTYKAFLPAYPFQGETIRNYPAFTVPSDSCFVLGDNTVNSRDSRYYGPISKQAIIGKIVYINKRKRNRKIEQVRIKSGANRHEIEKILAYGNNSNILVKKSAEYLIGNMLNLYSFESTLIDEGVKTKLSEIYRSGDAGETSLRGINEIFNNREKIYDVNIITADYIIENIELALIQYQSKEWNQSLSFEDFCELILPYRIGTEPIQRWRRQYYEAYSYILNETYTGSDPIDATNAIFQALAGQLFMYYPYFKLPNLGPEFLLKNRIGGCRETCDFTLYLMRALGLPVATDYYNQENVHMWNVVKDTDGSMVQFLFNVYGGNAAVRGAGDGRTKGKVWRITFGADSPADVTSDYFGANEYRVSTTVPILSKKTHLGMFTNAHWFPVCASSSAKSRSAIYNDIEPGVVYITLDTKGKEISYPFVPLTDGSVKYFIPDPNTAENICLTRKVRITDHLRDIMTESNGTTIYGHTTEKRIHMLGKIESHVDGSTFSFSCPSNDLFDCLEIIPAPQSAISLAELSAVDNKGNKIRLIDDTEKYNNMLDGDPLSYIYETSPIILELESPSPISEIKWIPRNDDNFIRKGDTYELYFQNGSKGWILAGRQTATENHLFFKNVPSNALLLLHNTTRGKEEEVFYINTKGEQIFI